MPKSVIVIGAGIGGLAASIRLAQSGYDVTILEKNPRVGGKMYRYETSGFRWDTGPSLITNRPLLEEVFTDAGKDMADYLRLISVDPLTRYFFPDGATFDAHRDWAKMAAQIARLEPADVEGYLRFLAYAARLHRSVDPLALGGRSASTPDADFSSTTWIQADALRNMSRSIETFVQSKKLQRILEHFATLAGANPYRAPATLNVIAHRVLTGGAWYPQDGSSAIPRALERLALECGVKIQLNCPVTQIAVKRGRAVGVTLARDEQFQTADVVVSNVDVLSTLRYLLPSDVVPPPALRRLNKARVTSSAYVIMLGVRGTFPQLQHHNVLFSADSRREYDQIFKREIMPDDPTITLTISGKTDPLHAPVNQENWLITVNAPSLSEKFDWAARHAEFRDRVITILNQRNGLDLRDRIRSENHLTQADLARMTGAWRGSLYGRSPEDRQALFDRPHLQSRDLAGLYFVGGAVHPGGGFPMALLSAKLATEMILDEVN